MMRTFINQRKKIYQKGADFILSNKGGTDCRFHMIAIDKIENLGGTASLTCFD